MEPVVADLTPYDPEAEPASINPPPSPDRQPSVERRLLRVAGWFGLLALGAAAILPMLRFAWQGAATWALANSAPADARVALLSDWSGSNSPDYLEAVAELSLQQPTPDEASAYVAARRATELDPSRAFAWATLAYLEIRQTGGKVNAAALDALTKSMDACPLCDQELIRWRFNYVLANWAGTPEEIRARAFEQADLLRWVGPNEEFLAEMRYKAGLNHIPFDDYRSQVKTPARAWDIAPDAGPGSVRQSPA